MGSHPVKHRIVRNLRDPMAPVLDSDAEVRELISTNSGESDDIATEGDHEAVDVGREDLTLPTPSDVLARKRMCVLWKDLGESDHCARLLDVKNPGNIRGSHLAQEYRR